MSQQLIVPELNYWIKKILLKSPINEKFFHVPVEISDFWKEENSVLDLLFNENFKSTILPTDDLSNQDPPKQYIYTYRTCDIKTITDQTLLNRINIYRYTIDVYAADTTKFLSLFDLTNSPVFVNAIFEDENVQDQLDIQNREDDMPDTDYTQEQDENAQRNPYFTYKSKIYYSSNYQLVKLDTDYEFDPLPPAPILSPVVNVFEFNEEEFMMLDLLFCYKTTNEVDLSDITCDSLSSSLSKNIFIFLNACFQKFDVCESDFKFSDGTNLLHSLYEKYVLDFVYRMKQKEYAVIFKPSDNINNKLVEINQDFLLTLKNKLEYIYLTDKNISTKKIIINDEYIPWDRADFNIFHNGSLLKQDRDFTVQVNSSDASDIYYEIILNSNIFSSGDKIICKWSYMDPSSAFSQNLPKKYLDPQFNPSEQIEQAFSKIENFKSYVT